jgi:hypothetical protein
MGPFSTMKTWTATTLVAYDLSATTSGSEVRASISVRSGKGFTGRLLAEATNALLSAGALTHALSRLTREAACPA